MFEVQLYFKNQFCESIRKGRNIVETQWVDVNLCRSAKDRIYTSLNYKRTNIV